MRHTREQQTQFQVTDSRRLTFYPIVFGEITTIYRRDGSSYRETLSPGMFDDSLKDSSNEVIATVDHKPELTIAKRSDNSLILAKDQHGVFASCWLPATELGDKVLAGVADGTIWGCSCGWEDGQTQTRSDGVVEWLSGKLFDVTVVMNGEPAYKTTEVHLRSNNYLNSLLAKLNYVNFKIKMHYIRYGENNKS